MNKDQGSENLEHLLEEIGTTAAKTDEVSLGDIMNLLGRRSFGPLLLIAGVITLAPIIGDIPGVPTTMGVFVFLLAIQLMVRRDYFWLPEWILKRSVEPEKIRKTLKWFRKPARFFDRYLKPRLKIFSEGFAVYVIAAVSLIIAVAMPVMEFIPFSANIAGVALTALGLSLITRDGLLALLAFGFTVAVVVVLVLNWDKLPL